jgi:hypothetical protein
MEIDKADLAMRFCLSSTFYRACSVNPPDHIVCPQTLQGFEEASLASKEAAYASKETSLEA